MSNCKATYDEIKKEFEEYCLRNNTQSFCNNRFERKENGTYLNPVIYDLFDMYCAGRDSKAKETSANTERLKSIIRLLRQRYHKTQGKQDIERKELELLGLTVEELYEV